MEKNRLKVLFIVPYPINTVPGQRFRYEQYLSLLESEGIQYKLCPFVSERFMQVLYKKGDVLLKIIYTIGGYLYRFVNIIEGMRYEIIYIFRESTPFGPPLMEYIFYLIGKVLIFDFDDAIYLSTSSNSNRMAKFFKNTKKIKSIIRISNCILAGNRNLMNYAKRFNKNTLVVPTVINTDTYVPCSARTENRLCIGWTGSHSTVNYLNIVKNVIKDLSNKYGIVFKIIGSTEFNIEAANVKVQEWNLKTEIEDLGEIDIGVMPLDDDEWSRGKCGLKALQYMALGIPTVCSPVGVNTEIIQDGINGFLANTEEEWYEKLSLLVENAELRSRIGMAGRKTIEKYYSLKAHGPRFIDVLRKVYDSRSGYINYEIECAQNPRF